MADCPMSLEPIRADEEELCNLLIEIPHSSSGSRTIDTNEVGEAATMLHHSKGIKSSQASKVPQRKKARLRWSRNGRMGSQTCLVWVPDSEGEIKPRLSFPRT